MTDYYQPVKITDSVYWVGAIDWDIRDFHGYSVNRGTTYNAYLIVTDKVTLIDTVKEQHLPEMLARISKIVEPEKISRIISNHSEMDHSGGLPKVAAWVRPDQILASKMGVKALKSHFPDAEMQVEEVASGDVIDIGGRTLKFLETRMLHWPDSMFTYMPEERLLFSQDAFGLHLATAERFADQIGPTVIYREMAKYYANILMPYAHLVTKLLDTISTMNMKIDIIANDHGPVFRRDIDTVIEWYQKWSAQLPTDKAIILYDSMWGSTQRMGKIIAEGVLAGGGRPSILSAGGVHRSDIAVELLHAGALIAGSPTLNNTLFPTMADVLFYLKGLRRRNLVGAAFGSYGWSGEAVGQIRQLMEDMNVEILSELKTQYVPDNQAVDDCYQLGVSIGRRLSENKR